MDSDKYYQSHLRFASSIIITGQSTLPADFAAGTLSVNASREVATGNNQGIFHTLRTRLILNSVQLNPCLAIPRKQLCHTLITSVHGYCQKMRGQLIFEICIIHVLQKYTSVLVGLS